MSDPADFRLTRWSLIAAVQSGDAPRAKEAMDTLCQAYWYPLYAYVRRLGHPPEDAADLTQGFFSHLIEKDLLVRARPERGRLRNYLLTSIQNFIRGQWRKQQRACRGGASVLPSIDTSTAEGRYAREPIEVDTPESLYERRWALTLLERVLRGMQHEYVEQGKGHIFEVLKPTLTGDPAADTAAENGEVLGMTAGAVRVAVCRLRARYRDRLVAEVAASMVARTTAEVDEEIAALFRALR